MNRYFLSILLFALMCGCRSAPFKVETLSHKPTKVEPTDRKLLRDFEGTINEGMQARYRSKRSPSFGLINGYYKLPKAKPFGAASVVRAYSYQTYFEALEVSESEQPYALEPISGDDAIAYQKALNSLLDIGVKIKDISMTDALKIAHAESESFKKNQIFHPAKILPPGVDYLISIYPSNSVRGPVLVGRVIKKDGTLVAFRVVYRGASSSLVGGLIISLFEDTISRI